MAVVITGNNTPTAGGVTYGDGTTYANTAAGTSGQLLQSNGASAPSWVTASSGAMTLLSTVTASASATVDIETTFSSTYDTYMITGSNVSVAGGGVQLLCVPKLGGSYTPVAGAEYRGSVASFTSVTAVNQSSSTGASSVFSIINTGWDSSESNRRLNFIMEVQGQVASATEGKSVTIRGSYRNGVSTAFTFVGGCSFRTSNFVCTALTGIRFYPDTGTLSGTFRLYGIVNS
jgi:hypothetical protein